MRADAAKNFEHLLKVARDVVTEQGADASLRDIARRAGVGLATLYRHFPTREALLEALLRTSLDRLTKRAELLKASPSPDKALATWLSEAVAFVRTYNGVVAVMAAALADERSALHASCTNLRSAGTELLHRARAAGLAKANVNGVDLFALIGALGWIGDQPSFAPRADQLLKLVTAAILTDKPKRRGRKR